MRTRRGSSTAGCWGWSRWRSRSRCAARGGVWFEQLHVGVEQDFAPARKAHPALRVDELDALAARLSAAGATVEWDDALPGVRRFYTADPWGNRVELLG